MIIKVNKPQDIHALFDKAKKDAAENGITWQGDITQGHGSGFGFEGQYVIDENHITITVTKRPLLVSKSRIKNEVENYVNTKIGTP
ncbi:MAG: hypothetical protein FWC32_08430 [Firmicutes bacterium]|nr:hypothetical protein [Bacillota bacterium]